MPERIIALSVDSFPKDDIEGYVGISKLLHSEDAVATISSLELPADLFMEYHRYEAIKPFVAGAPGALDKLPVIADVSLSGGYNTAERQIAYILRNYRTETMTFIVNHGMANKGIEKLQRNFADDKINFLLTGVLPENLPENFEESFGMNVLEFTTHVKTRAKNLGITGVYGSAEYATNDEELAYVGAGISMNGGIYTSDGVEKRSTALRDAAKTCTQLVIGNMIVNHPVSPLQAVKDIREVLQKDRLCTQ